MKRKVLLMILVLFFSVVGVIKAQAFDFNKAYQDYVYNLGLYQAAHSNYDLAKAAYLKSQTPGSTQDAINATRTMLMTRDDVVATYLTTLRMKLLETKGVTDAEKSGYFTQLDTDVAWYGSHKGKIVSAGSLNDLVKDSDEAKDRYSGTQILIYQTLIEIGVSENTFERNAIQGEIGLLNQKISEIRLNGDKDTSSIERFLVDVENKLSRSSEKETEAKNIVGSIKASVQNSYGTYQTAVSDIQDSLSYLKEANNGLREVVTQIKTN